MRNHLRAGQHRTWRDSWMVQSGPVHHGSRHQLRDRSFGLRVGGLTSWIAFYFAWHLARTAASARSSVFVRTTLLLIAKHSLQSVRLQARKTSPVGLWLLSVGELTPRVFGENYYRPPRDQRAPHSCPSIHPIWPKLADTIAANS